MTGQPKRVEVVPFHSGTEGGDFTSKWCAYCRYDHQMHGTDVGPGCLTFGSALADLDRDTAGADHYSHHWWTTGPREFGGNYVTCTRFDACDTDPCSGDHPDAEIERQLRITAAREAAESAPAPLTCPDCGEVIEYNSCQQPNTGAVADIVLAAHRKLKHPTTQRPTL